MRTTAIAVALLALALAPALPSEPAAHATTFTCKDFDHLHWRDRLDPGRARCAITTEDGDVTLLLTDRDVAFQLSERTLSRVHRKLWDAEHDQDNWLASVIVTTVTSTVREVLDHSFVYHVRDLRDVSYEDGRLVFTGRDGRLLFGDGAFCDSDASGAFSERDALKFVREFRRVKGGD